MGLPNGYNGDLGKCSLGRIGETDACLKMMEEGCEVRKDGLSLFQGAFPEKERWTEL